MSKDPVCGAQVNEQRPGATATQECQNFFFCCPHCKDEFLKNPQRYVAKQQPGTAAGCCG
ncbi:MAG: YHS domain-containing protein [Candidatus Omnitrophica bacterium]|nr:YHS domain-containing protein [Candidatus Omnitrophota bacterium]